VTTPWLEPCGCACTGPGGCRGLRAVPGPSPRRVVARKNRGRSVRRLGTSWHGEIKVGPYGPLRGMRYWTSGSAQRRASRSRMREANRSVSVSAEALPELCEVLSVPRRCRSSATLCLGQGITEALLRSGLSGWSCAHHPLALVVCSSCLVYLPEPRRVGGASWPGWRCRPSDTGTSPMRHSDWPRGRTTRVNPRHSSWHDSADCAAAGQAQLSSADMRARREDSGDLVDVLDGTSRTRYGVVLSPGNSSGILASWTAAC